MSVDAHELERGALKRKDREQLLTIASALGRGMGTAVLALTLVWWPSYARMIRGQVLSIKQNVFVDAARAEGLDITADMYPYPASGTGLDAMLPTWVHADGKFWQNLADPAICQRIKAEILADKGEMAGTAPDEVMPIGFKQPDLKRYAGRRLSEIAAERGLALNVVHEHDSTRVLRSLHLAGAGFTFSPASSAVEHPTPLEGWLRARIVEPEIVRRYHLAQPLHRGLTPAAAAVAEELRALVRELIDNGTWDARLA